MKKRYFLNILFFVAFFLISVSAKAQSPCEPKNEFLSNLELERVKKCLHYTQVTLGRYGKADEKFVDEFIETLLPTSEEGVKRINKICYLDNYYNQISEIISLSKSKKLIKRYIDFIIFTSNSADERRSLGLGELYTLQAPEFLKILSNYSKSDLDIIIQKLSAGLVNNHWPHINNDNYQRLIVGEYWELVDKKYPYRNLSKQIEDAVYSLISAKK
jgi:hypothetical protein